MESANFWMQTAATRFSYNWSYTIPNDLQEDILESLWNFPQLFYYHQKLIQILTRSNTSIFQIYSEYNQNLTEDLKVM